MARVGYTYTATPSSGQGTAMRAFFAANLTTWTVGALQTFGSGSNERNYFVLTSTFGGQEVLVTVPNGLTADVSTSINSGFRFSGQTSDTTDLTIAFGLALDGGYAASFGLGRDPSNADFFPARTTRFVPQHLWNRNQPEQVMYIIEDTASAALFIYTGFNSNNSGYTLWAYASNMAVFDRMPNEPSFNWSGDVVYHIQVSTNTTSNPKTLNRQYAWYHYPGQTEQYIEEQNANVVTSQWVFLSDATQPNPETGTFSTSRSHNLLVEYEGVGDEITARGFIGQINPSIMRQFGRTVSTYRKKLIGDSGEVFVHVYEDLITPWAGNLPFPS